MRSAAVGVALAFVLSGCTPGNQTDGAPAVAPSSTAPAVVVPADWHWEGYGDVEVAVPSGWGYGVSGMSSCVRGSAEAPYVGRPGAVIKPGCLGDETQVAVGGTFVWFEPPHPQDDPPLRAEGDRQVVDVTPSVTVAVQAPNDLRKRILATVRTVERDVNGCPVTHPASRDPSWPPPVSGNGAAQAVSACRYWFGGAGPTLISSIRLDGPGAAGAVAAATTGPAVRDAAEGCRAQDEYGQEVIVLRAGSREVVMRYAGCEHDGFDDGSVVRPLSRAEVAPFVTGANATRVAAPEMGAYDPRTGDA